MHTHRAVPVGLLALTLAFAVGSADAFPRGGGNFRGGAPTSVNRPAFQPQARNVDRGNINRDRGANVNRNINDRTNIDRDRNINRNTNINRDVNVNRNVDVDVHGNGWYDDYHPVATAAAVTTAAVVTSAVVGSIVRSIPPSCTAVIVNGVTYQQCGSTWYQPQYAGSSVQYVVVNSPR